MQINIVKVNPAYASNAQLAALVDSQATFYNTVSEIRRHSKARGATVEKSSTHGIAFRNKKGLLIGEFWFSSNIGRVFKGSL